MVVHTKLSMEELESAASVFGISAKELTLKHEPDGITIQADAPRAVAFLEHLLSRGWATRRW